MYIIILIKTLKYFKVSILYDKTCKLFPKVAQWIKHLSAMQETQEMQVWSLVRKIPGVGHGSSVQFSHSPVSDSLWPHGLQHTRLPLPTLRACSDLCLSSPRCHPTILCRFLLLLPSIFPRIRVFSNELVLCIRWPKYWNFSFSISPSNEYSGMISFRMYWLDLL